MKNEYPALLLAIFFVVGIPLSGIIHAQCDDLALVIASDPQPPFLLCAGETITLTGEVTGGTGPYDWWWTDGSTTQSIVLTLPSIGNLELTVTDANDCSVTAFIHIKAYVWTTEIVFSPSPICEGDSMGLYAWPDFPPGTEFLWSTGETTSSIFVPSSGTYSLTTTNPSGACSASASVGVTVNTMPSPTVDIVGPTVLCGNETITLTAQGAPEYGYYWSTDAETTSINVSEPGLYWVQAVNIHGCTDLDSIQVISGAVSPELSGPAALCAGESGTIGVTNATAYTSFEWSTGQTSASISVNSPGTYAVTATAVGGCWASSSITVAAGNASINITGTTTPLSSCVSNNGAINISVSPPSGSYGYEWSNGAVSEDLTGLSDGSYIVTVTSSSGCDATANFTVANAIVLPEATLSSTDASCGQNNGAVNLEVTPPGSYTYLWSNGATSQNLSSLAPGNYAVTTTSSNGCATTASATVASASTAFTVEGAVTQPSSGQNNGTIDLTVSPPGAYNFIWSNGATTADVAGLGEGSYSVTVSDNGGCTVVSTFVLEAVGCNMSVFISVDTPSPSVVCEGDFVTVMANVTGGTAPYDFDWSNGINTQTFSVEPPLSETLVLIVTDNQGCTAFATFHVKINVWSFDINYTSFPICQGDSVALIIATTAALPGTEYLWSTGETTPIIYVTSSGTYSATMSNPNVSCMASNTATITILPTPTPAPQIIGPSVLCPGQTTTLSLSGGPFSSYNWSTGDNQPTIQVSEPGLYTVYVENAEGCLGTDDLEIVAGSISPELNNPMSICPGQSTVVEVTNAAEFATFQWSNGGTGPAITVSEPGTYTVSVTAPGGCMATASVDVLNNNTSFAIEATPTDNTACANPNGSINITISPAGAYSFLWSNGASSEDLQNLNAGQYGLTVTDASGCNASANFSLANNTTNPLLNTTATDASCGQPNGAIDLSVMPPSGNTFLWSNGAGTEDVQNLTPGDYSVTVTDANGCVAFTSVSLANNNTSFAIEATPTDNTACINPNGSINVTISPAGAYSFLWSNGASSEDLQNLNAGQYGLTVTDASGCNASANFSLANNTTNPLLNTTATDASCGQPNGAIDLSVMPPSGNTFLWSNGAGTEDVQNLTPGDYSVTVTDANGCVAFTSVSLANNNTSFAIEATPTDNTACANPNGSINITISPAGAYSFLWSNGASSEDLQNLNAGQYGLTVTDASGCMDVFSATIAGPVLPQVIITGATSTCQGQSVTFNASSGFVAYQWSGGQNTSSISVTEAGTYHLSATDSQGCMATASYTLAVVPSPMPIITATATCDGSANLDAGAGYASYLWSNGMTTPNFTTTIEGIYHVLVTAANGCSGRDTLQLSLLTPPQVQITGSAALCQGDETMLAVPGNFSQYLWSTGATSSSINIMEGGLYGVTVTDASGCVAIDEWWVDAVPVSYTLVEQTSCSVQDTGTIIHLLSNQYGCDSLVVITTSWVANPTTEVQLYACPNALVLFNGSSIPVGSTQVFTFPAANGCDSLVTVQALALPGLSFSLESSPSCWNLADGTIRVSVLEGTEPYRYAVDNGAFQLMPTFAGLSAGSHSVLMEDGNGCTAIQNIQIPQTSPTQVELPELSLSCELDQAIIRPIVINSQAEDLIWRWQDGSGNPWLLVTEAGTYTFSLDDGCEISTHTVDVKWDNARLPRDWFYVPNCFSPNADGVNDKFQVFPGQDFEILSFEFRIFDRWGDALFMTTDPAIGWDGVHQGIEMQPAVYGWYLNAQLRVCGGRELDVFKKGGVTIVR